MLIICSVPGSDVGTEEVTQSVCIAYITLSCKGEERDSKMKCIVLILDGDSALKKH